MEHILLTKKHKKDLAVIEKTIGKSSAKILEYPIVHNGGDNKYITACRACDICDIWVSLLIGRADEVPDYLVDTEKLKLRMKLAETHVNLNDCNAVTLQDAVDFPKASALEAGEYLFSFNETIDVSGYLPFVGRERTRYYLCGLFVADNYVFAATNGHIAKTNYPEGKYGRGVIIPFDVLELLKDRMIDTMTVYENLVMIHSGDIRVVCKTIDGQFPDYQRVIPKKDANSIEVSFDWQKLRDILRTLNPKKANAKGSENCYVRFANGVVYYADMPLDITYESSMPYNTAFAGSYLLNVLDGIKTDCDFYARNIGSPFVAVTNDSTMVVMPLRV